MYFSRHKLQSNCKIDRNGDYIIGQNFYLPILKYYTEEQAWDFLKNFDLTRRNIRKTHLDHFRTNK